MYTHLVALRQDAAQDARMITGRQIRGARAMLGWQLGDLATRTGLSKPTISRIEAAVGVPTMTTVNMMKVQRALEDAGIVFIAADASGGVGVRFSRGER